MSKIISYVGFERCDVVYYMQKIMSHLNKRVLVIDNSESHDLIISVAKFTGDDVIQRKRTVFLKDRQIIEPIEAFDYVLVYHGLNSDADVVAISDEVIVALGYDKISLEKCRNAIEFAEIHKPCYILWRDKTSKKISEKNEEAKMKLIAKGHFIEELDPVDLSMYVSLTHNGTQSLKKAKTETSLTVQALISEITETKPALIKKAIKQM